MKITERMLEDWICENPEEALGMTLLGRQVRLDHGILDVLGYRPDIRKIVCAELKAQPLKEKDIGQVLRYAADVDYLVRMAWHRVEEGPSDFLSMWDHCIVHRVYSDAPKSYRDDIFDRLFFDDWTRGCCPTLIGPSIDDFALVAARGVGIVVLLWSYEDGKFNLGLPQNKWILNDKFPEWVRQALHLHIKYTSQEAIKIVDEDIDPLLVGI